MRKYALMQTITKNVKEAIFIDVIVGMIYILKLKKYKNTIIATHLRDDTREELQKKCLKDVKINEDGVEIIID